METEEITIFRIQEKLQFLKEITPPDRNGKKERYLLNPKIKEADLLHFESVNQVLLPSEYRLFLSHLGNGGAGPSVGIKPLSPVERNHWLCQEFPLTQTIGGPIQSDQHAAEREFLETFPLPQLSTVAGSDFKESQEPIYTWLKKGVLPISIQQFDAKLSYFLVVTGQSRGSVWHDYGYPNEVGKEAPDFLTWYEAWLDKKIKKIQKEQQEKRERIAAYQELIKTNPEHWEYYYQVLEWACPRVGMVESQFYESGQEKTYRYQLLQLSPSNRDCLAAQLRFFQKEQDSVAVQKTIVQAEKYAKKHARLAFEIASALIWLGQSDTAQFWLEHTEKLIFVKGVVRGGFPEIEYELVRLWLSLPAGVQGALAYCQRRQWTNLWYVFRKLNKAGLYQGVLDLIATKNTLSALEQKEEAYAYTKLQQFAKALSLYEACAEDEVDVWQERVYLLEKQGLYQEAIFLVEKVIKELNLSDFSSQAMPLQILGSLYRGVGNHQKALDLFIKSYQINYTLFSYASQGYELIQLGRDKEAFEIGKDILSCDPEYPIGFCLMAVLEAKQGNQEQAKMWINKAQEKVGLEESSSDLLEEFLVKKLVLQFTQLYQAFASEVPRLMIP